MHRYQDYDVSECTYYRMFSCPNIYLTLPSLPSYPTFLAFIPSLPPSLPPSQSAIPALFTSTFVQLCNMPIIRATITLQNPASPYQNTSEALQAIYSKGGIKVGREGGREGKERREKEGVVDD